MPEALTRSAKVGATEIHVETGRLARQAGGAVLMQAGDSVMLITACNGPHKPDARFFPLVVNYEERQYAGGRIPGGFFRREGRPGDLEILTARLTDRPIRPLFPEGYKGDVQIIATVMSHDLEHDTDVMCITGASAALMLSSAPFEGPVAGVRVIRVDGELIANPTRTQRESAELDIVMAVTRDAITMVEGHAKEVPEAEMVDALDFGFDAAQPLIDLQIDLANEVGREKEIFVPEEPVPGLKEAIDKACREPLRKAMSLHQKEERYAATDEVKAQAKALVEEKFAEHTDRVGDLFEALKSDVARTGTLDDGRRIDGRGYREIRKIDTEAGVLPRTHGSALFTRGETQGMAVVTLGTGRDARMIDAVTGKEEMRFMLHYNFAPFSVGEVRMMRGVSRRETGHGWLAQRAVEQVLPAFAEFPYVIRVVSETLESNGSSSMAAICGASMALMDAGVPISKPVAGIAMGLISDGKRHAILSDILGDEDHLGDMDFKVAGTEDGITSLQMDIKIKGLSRDIMTEALMQAFEGRKHILGKMAEAIDAPRSDLAEFAPRITSIHISPDRIRDIIGSGGKTIRAITERTGCQINVEDDGKVDISSTSREATKQAIEIIEALTAEPAIGEIYLGTVAKVTDFGAFVTILPGVDGLVHISEISEERVERVEDVLNEGDEVIVKCTGLERGGKVRLSRKDALGKKPTVIATKLEL